MAGCTGSGGGASGDETTTTASGATTTTTSLSPMPSWREIDPPTVDGSTDAIVVSNGVLADGRYWGTISRISGTDEAVFTVARAYFGAECEAWAADRGMTEGCPNDYAVDDADTALVALAPGATVSVVFQEGPGTSYAIDADTVRRLVLGTATSPIAMYEWVPFPFLVTVKDGVVVAAHQVWVP